MHGRRGPRRGRDRRCPPAVGRLGRGRPRAPAGRRRCGSCWARPVGRSSNRSGGSGAAACWPASTCPRSEPDQVAELIERAAGAPPDRPTVDAFVADSGGLPAFLVDPLAAAVADGALSTSAGLVRLTGPLPDPAGLRDRWTALALTLDADERTALDLVCVAGQIDAATAREILPARGVRRARASRRAGAGPVARPLGRAGRGRGHPAIGAAGAGTGRGARGGPSSCCRRCRPRPARSELAVAAALAGQIDRVADAAAAVRTLMDEQRPDEAEDLASVGGRGRRPPLRADAGQAAVRARRPAGCGRPARAPAGRARARPVRAVRRGRRAGHAAPLGPRRRRGGDPAGPQHGGGLRWCRRPGPSRAPHGAGLRRAHRRGASSWPTSGRTSCSTAPRCSTRATSVAFALGGRGAEGVELARRGLDLCLAIGRRQPGARLGDPRAVAGPGAHRGRAGASRPSRSPRATTRPRSDGRPTWRGWPSPAPGWRWPAATWPDSIASVPRRPASSWPATTRSPLRWAVAGRLFAAALRADLADAVDGAPGRARRPRRVRGALPRARRGPRPGLGAGRARATGSAARRVLADAAAEAESLGNLALAAERVAHRVPPRRP